MKELLRAHSLSYAQGLQLSLEANEIKTVLLDEQSVAFMGFAGRVRLMVANDADYEHAMRIVRELQASAPAPQIGSSWKIQGLGCVGMLAGFVLAVVAATSLMDESRDKPYGLLAGAVVLFAIGLAMVIFGPRRDRSKPQ